MSQFKGVDIELEDPKDCQRMGGQVFAMLPVKIWSLAKK